MTRAWTVTVVALLAVAALAPSVVEGGPAPPAGSGRDWVVALVSTAMGARLLQDPGPAGRQLALMGTSAASTLALSPWPEVPAAAWVAAWCWVPAYTTAPAVLVSLTTALSGGRPTRSARSVCLLGTVGTAALVLGLAWAARPSPVTFWDDAAAGTVTRGPAVVLVGMGVVAVVAAAVLAVAVSAVRLRDARTPAAARLWALVAAGLSGAALVLELVGAPGVWWIGAAAVPVATAVAVARWGIADVGLVVHRSVLDGLCAAGLVAVHAATALVAGRAAPGRAADVATVATVLAVVPVRTAAQRWADRALHGDAGRPETALAALGRRFEAVGAPRDALSEAVGQVAASLRAPAVVLRDPAGTVLARTGRSRRWPQAVVPLVFRGTTVAELAVEHRAADETYSAREHTLLVELARSLAPLAEATALAEALAAARDRVVRAREEERRRLRRDLHDRVAAALSGIAMQLSAARRAMAENPSRAAAVLDAARRDLTATSAEVRFLVEGLRPASLDDGLALAVERQVRRLAGELDLDVDVRRCPQALPPAVEVAAFHIVTEAVTNVVRHAEARTCGVVVDVAAGHLRVEVTDDGVARGSRPPATRGGGVGLATMRERAEELGGTVDLDLTAGTRLVAVLPVPDPWRLA